MHRLRSQPAVWCVTSFALLGAAASAGCGSAKPDGLYTALAGAGGAAAGAAGAGVSGSSGAGSIAGSGGSDGGSGGVDSGVDSGGAGGSAGAGNIAGSGGSGGSGVVPELDAGADAALEDASAASRLSCAPSQQADCESLAAALAHRYSFTGSGNAVIDSVGSAHGSIVNGQLSGAGSVVLTGAEAPENYVNLPNGLVSALASATFEAWLSWSGGAPWQRIFDFGSSQTGENTRGGGAEYLFLTPRSDLDTVRVAFISSDTPGEIQVNSAAPLPTGVTSHVAVVVDAVADTLALFTNGALAGSIALPSSLAALATDDNNWLGRSEFPTDPALAGSLLELRIYAAALSPQQLALSYQLGPDAALLP